MRAVTAVLAALICLPSIVLADEPVRAPLPLSKNAERTDLATAPPAIPCTCRYRGQDIGLGDAVCMNGRLARCEMVLNNTSWSFTESPCPLASLAPRG